MLARLSQIDGVQSTSASLGNQGGALVRISARPGVDAAKIAAQVRRILSDEVKDRTLVRLGSQAAAVLLQEKEWLDTNQLAELAATEVRAPEGRAPALLGALLLSLAVGLGLLGWRQLVHRRAGPSRSRPRLCHYP